MIVPVFVAVPAVGFPVAEFAVRTRSGDLYQWHPGRLTVISVCAMWCNTWKQQLPRLAKAEQSLAGLPVDYLAISVDGRWLERVPSSTALLADPGGSWTKSIGIDRVPYTLVLDERGVIRSSQYGISRSDEIVSHVREAMRPESGGDIFLAFDGLSDDLLDILRSQKVPVTFYGERRQTLVARALQEGHVVREGGPGNRGFGTHFLEDPFDETRPGKRELLRRILNNARSGAVIALHAGVEDSVSILPEVIDNLRSRGYRFRTLEPGTHMGMAATAHSG